MSRTPETAYTAEPPADFRTYQQQFVDCLRDPSKQADASYTMPAGVEIYGKLLFGKIDGSLRRCFPIARALSGAEHWQRLLRIFIREHRCRTPLYREIPDEFIDFLLDTAYPLELPEFFTELAHYEWMELTLETALPTAFPDSVLFTDPSVQVPLLNPVLHVLHYRFPVHRITADDPHWQSWQRRTEPYSTETVTLAGFRSREFDVRFIEINPLTARLIELLREETHTGAEALRQLAAALGFDDPARLMAHGLDLLKELQTRQIVIGARDD